MSDQIGFYEKKGGDFWNLVYMLDYRIFIFGVEVTDYVTHSIDWTLSNRDGPNSATFSLNNTFDNFILTKQNLAGNFRIPSDKSTMYSEVAKQKIYNNKKSLNTNATTELYTLGDRNLVIQKNDPLRIFINNPISPADQWMNVFTGYVKSAQKKTNYVTGESTISITCYDIKALMQRMRVSLSPTYGQLVQREILIGQGSFFADLISPSLTNNPFTKADPNVAIPFETAMDGLILGKGLQAAQTANGPVLQGVGQFTKGDQYYYNPEGNSTTADLYGDNSAYAGSKSFSSNSDMLNDWYNLCLFGEARTWMTTPQVTALGTGTWAGGDSPPDAQKYYIMLPTGGTKTQQMTQFHFSNGVEQREFISRYEMITQFCEVIDYQWWVTGNGDIVFELPMYEFLPSDFEYSNLLTVNHFIVEDNIVDEDGDFPTALTVTGNQVSSFADTNLANGEGGPIAITTPRVMIASPQLTARLGFKNEEHQIPTVHNYTSLKLLAVAEYNKRLSESSKLDLNFSYRPWLLPNKPFLHQHEKRIGITTSVTNRINFYKDGGTDVTLNYIRKQNSQGNYVFIDGSTSFINSWRTAWASNLGVALGSNTIIIDASTGNTTAGTFNQ